MRREPNHRNILPAHCARKLVVGCCHHSVRVPGCPTTTLDERQLIRGFRAAMRVGVRQVGHAQRRVLQLTGGKLPW